VEVLSETDPFAFGLSSKLAKRAYGLCPITLASNTTLMSCTCASEISSLHNLRGVVRLWWLDIPKHNESESVAVLSKIMEHLHGSCSSSIVRE